MRRHHCGGHEARRGFRAAAARAAEEIIVTAHAAAHARVDGGAKENLRLVADLFAERLHEDLHLVQRHVRSATDIHQDVVRFLQHAAAIHERIAQRAGQRLVRAVVPFRLAVAEEAAPDAARAGPERGAKIVEPDMQDARLGEETGHGAHALADGFIRRGEGLVDARPWAARRRPSRRYRSK